MIRFLFWSIIVLCVLSGIRQACATDLWLSATVASYHSNRDAEYNERNYGLGFEYGAADRWRAVGGVYDNSYYRTTVYGGALYLYPVSQSIKVGVMLGLASGYSHVVGPLAPVALPTIAIEGKQFGANIGVMPSRGGGIGTVGLQVKAVLR